MRLHNKTAIVTDAASGIGWASAAAFLQQGSQVTPLDEIANGAVYLTSEESSFVTGTDLVIDGGYLAQ